MTQLIRRRSFLGLLGAVAATVPFATKLLAFEQGPEQPPLPSPSAAMGAIIYPDQTVLSRDGKPVLAITSLSFVHQPQKYENATYENCPNFIEIIRTHVSELVAFGKLLVPVDIPGLGDQREPWSIRIKQSKATWNFDAWLHSWEVTSEYGEACQAKLCFSVCGDNLTYRVEN